MIFKDMMKRKENTMKCQIVCQLTVKRKTRDRKVITSPYRSSSTGKVDKISDIDIEKSLMVLDSDFSEWKSLLKVPLPMIWHPIPDWHFREMKRQESWPFRWEKSPLPTSGFHESSFSLNQIPHVFQPQLVTMREERGRNTGRNERNHRKNHRGKPTPEILDFTCLTVLLKLQKMRFAISHRGSSHNCQSVYLIRFSGESSSSSTWSTAVVSHLISQHILLPLCNETVTFSSREEESHLMK